MNSMGFHQYTIFDRAIVAQKKEKVLDNKLTTIEHEILNTIKLRPVSTEGIMETYDLERVDVRRMIQRIRRYKPGNTMVMNCRVEYRGKMCHGYSVEGNDVLFTRWLSSTKTLLANDPFKLEMCYAELNRIKETIERPSEKQTKIPLTPDAKPHDVTYRNYNEDKKI